MKQQISGKILGKVFGISRFLKLQVQFDIENLKKWRLAAPLRMREKLNNEAAESDYRYRNIDKPFPLL